MLQIHFKSSFLRRLQRLDATLQDEVFEKIELFKDVKNHKILKVHKLHGDLSGCSSFSVNYKFRIVFEYESKNSTILLLIGDHDIYK